MALYAHYKKKKALTQHFISFLILNSMHNYLIQISAHSLRRKAGADTAILNKQGEQIFASKEQQGYLQC